jgi:hypothetical protein
MQLCLGETQRMRQILPRGDRTLRCSDNREARKGLHGRGDGRNWPHVVTDGVVYHTITHISATAETPGAEHGTTKLLKYASIATDGGSIDGRGDCWQALWAGAERGGSGNHTRSGARGRSPVALGDRVATEECHVAVALLR